MRNAIWKFPLAPGDTLRILIPCGDDRDNGARFLSVQKQEDRLVLWAMVDTRLTPTQFRVRIVNTGEDAPDVSDMLYVGTVQMENAIVKHVFVEAVFR